MAVSAAKALGGLVVLGVVVAGGLYVGDRYAESRAEEYAVGVVSQSIPTTEPPVVDIKGFPFLTQLMGGTLDEVSATAAGATLEGIPVTDVAVDATQVNVRPPAGLVLSRADVVPTGLRITADGTNVVVPQTTTG